MITSLNGPEITHQTPKLTILSFPDLQDDSSRSAPQGLQTPEVRSHPDLQIGDGLNRIAVKLGFAGCSELVEFNDTHTHAEVLARVDDGVHYWILLDVSNRVLVW